MDLKELTYRLHFTLPTEQLKRIVVHSSFEPQDAALRKRNMNYYELGKSIVLASYALYLFDNDITLTNRELSLKLQGSAKHFEIAIYNEFALEEFVIKSKDEQETPHTDIATKLVALIYKNYGFIYCYRFLSPYFREINGEEPIDFKALIIKLSQKKKRTPRYEIDRTSSDSDNYFACKVNVGKKSTIAYAFEKEEAEEAAAKQFILQTNFCIESTKRNKIKSLTHSISDERKEDLRKLFGLLYLRKDMISLRLLDMIMTDNAHVNESRNIEFKSDNCLSVVGSYVLEMYCHDYIIEKSDICADYIDKWETLLSEERLALKIPDKCMSYFLTEETVDNTSISNRLKAKILKRLIGVMMYNYVIAYSNQTMIDMVQRYTYKVFAKIERNNIFNYKNFLQDVIELFHFGIEYTYEQKEQSTNDKNVYICYVEVAGDDWVENEKGVGPDKESAANDAAKYILPLLVPYCSVDRQVKDTILHVINNGDQLKGNDKIKLELSKNTVSESFNYNRYNTANSNDNTPIKNLVPKNVSFDNNEHILYICKGTVSCNNRGHKIVSSTGILASLDGEPIKINTNYCLDCQLFFINYREYKFYRHLYGILLGNFSIQKNINGKVKGYNSLATESILHLCGYNVNESQNLTPAQRRYILAFLMDHDILSKSEIINYLQSFIFRGEGNIKMIWAIQKWEDDLDWVRNYNIDTQPQFNISSIQKYYRKK